MKQSIGLVLLFACAVATAGAITDLENFYSGYGATGNSSTGCPVGQSSCQWNNLSGANFLIPESDNNSAWAANPNQYTSWVSYENTGWNFSQNQLFNTVPIADCGQGSTPGVDGCEPNDTFYEEFTVSGTSLTLNLNVWADDTAGIYLYNTQTDVSTLLANPNFVQTPGTSCGPAGVTCSGGGDQISVPISNGTYIVEFQVYQIGGWTYGLMYDGNVTGIPSAPPNNPTPEPASIALFGTGLVGLIALGLGRKRIF